MTDTKFILNHIDLTFEEGLDIATAIRSGEEYDFDSIKPAREMFHPPRYVERGDDTKRTGDEVREV